MRRFTSGLAVLATLALAAGVMAAPVAAQDGSMAEHPFVGAWIIDPTPQDPSDPPDLFTVAAGGTVTSASSDGIGSGAWSASGDHSADVTFVVPSVDPEAGFMGLLTVRASVDVADDGASFSGTYTLEFPAAVSEAFGMPAGEVGPGEVTGQRVSVEPMGEQVGPIPDFSELAPPAAE